MEKDVLKKIIRELEYKPIDSYDDEQNCMLLEYFSSKYEVVFKRIGGNFKSFSVDCIGKIVEGD